MRTQEEKVEVRWENQGGLETCVDISLSLSPAVSLLSPIRPCSLNDNSLSLTLMPFLTVITSFILEARAVGKTDWSLSKTVVAMFWSQTPAPGLEGSTPAPSADRTWQTVEFQGLAANTKYNFRLRLVNAVGTGLPGKETSEFITLPPPLPPPRMIANLASIVLTWVPGDYEAFEIRVSYDIFIKGPPERSEWSPWTLRFGGKGESSLLLPNLLADTKYRTTMAGLNSGGWGEHGPIREGRTTLVAPPLKPFPLDLTQLQPTSATLNWYTPLTQNLQSSLGYVVYACTVDDADGIELLPAARPCSVPETQLQNCRNDFPEAMGHVCKNTASSYTRTALRKNTRYTLRLSMVNPGGPGPLGPHSSIFKTTTTHPERMPMVVAETVSMSVIHTTWLPLTEWNAR